MSNNQHTYIGLCYSC